MANEFEKCLKKHKIIQSSISNNLVNKEIQVAQKDLREAKDRLKHKSFKWSTVISYYAMFHTARALLYSKGYKERSHYCLSTALQELFVKPRILKASLNRAFLNAMNLREDADYAEEYSKKGAQEVISYADEFLKAAKQILSK